MQSRSDGVEFHQSELSPIEGKHVELRPGPREECRPLAPIKPGRGVTTSAHNLPNRYVIYCFGPVYGVDEPSDQLLASCYRDAFKLAEDKGIKSIAFPAISAGACGYPLEAAARVALKTVSDLLPDLLSVTYIRFAASF
ncbi:MAG: macro domain-containing protein [Thermodesulfobacteriota bacterium]